MRSHKRDEVGIAVGSNTKDEALFSDVLGLRGSRTPITAVVANLADPR